MMKKKRLLKSFIVLSLVGILISLYLVQNHYAPPSQGSFCDLGETLSCSLVNTSVFSELFHVPVALLGALWFFSLIIFSWKALSDDKFIPVILGWSVVGVLSIVYFVIAEIILQAVCPLCTAVHVIVLFVFIASILLYKRSKVKLNLTKVSSWIVFVGIINIIPFILFNVGGETENYDALAQCMTQKGVLMYGSFRCGICAKTRAMFGDSFQYIKEIECHPQGKNPQTELCLEKKIEGTPTWMLVENGVEKRAVGFLSIDELRTFSGCTDAS
ncbi:MAG TPA: vitamin K epoxide reductase family protein [Candidatus Nanoarchaeia archaeon]|nr:vitamin K epoxide reductase family protein [Candidatus Nanoarchaeia archaeon]